MIGVKDKSQSTVRTRLRSTLVQVDVYLGMAQSTTTSITGHLQHDRWKTSRCGDQDNTHHTLGDHLGWHRSYQVDGPLGVDLLLLPSHGKPGSSLVSLIELLPGVCDLVKLDGGEGEGTESDLAETGGGQLGAEQTWERHLKIDRIGQYTDREDIIINIIENLSFG